MTILHSVMIPLLIFTTLKNLSIDNSGESEISIFSFISISHFLSGMRILTRNSPGMKKVFSFDDDSAETGIQREPEDPLISSLESRTASGQIKSEKGENS